MNIRINPDFGIYGWSDQQIGNMPFFNQLFDKFFELDSPRMLLQDQFRTDEEIL